MSTNSRFAVTINNGDNWADYKTKTLAYALKQKSMKIMEGREHFPEDLPTGASDAAISKFNQSVEDF
jgi:hypothetical protein